MICMAQLFRVVFFGRLFETRQKVFSLVVIVSSIMLGTHAGGCRGHTPFLIILCMYAWYVRAYVSIYILNIFTYAYTYIYLLLFTCYAHVCMYECAHAACTPSLSPGL